MRAQLDPQLRANKPKWIGDIAVTECASSVAWLREQCLSCFAYVQITSACAIETIEKCAALLPHILHHAVPVCRFTLGEAPPRVKGIKVGGRCIATSAHRWRTPQKTLRRRHNFLRWTLALAPRLTPGFVHPRPGVCRGEHGGRCHCGGRRSVVVINGRHAAGALLAHSGSAPPFFVFIYFLIKKDCMHSRHGSCRPA